MVDDRQAQFKHLLKTRGFSLTKARLLVFEQLVGKEPQTMHELYESVGGKIDRASLYRVVDLFERLSIVERLQTGWKYKLELTDTFNRHHHHLTCIDCGQVFPIKEDEETEVLISRLAEKHQFLASRHQLEIQGYCAPCQAAKRSPSPN